MIGFVLQSRSSSDTEAGALMFGSLYFILIKYQLFCQVSNAETDVCVCVCVCVPARSLQLFPYTSRINFKHLVIVLLILHHCIKVCFYLCTITMKTNRMLLSAI